VAGSERVESKVLLGFIAALGLLYLSGGVTYRMGVSFANSAQWVTETQRIRAALGDLYAAVSDAEALERDYLLTGSSDYKLQYERVAAESRARTSAMYAMFEDDPTQLARLQVLESSIEDREDWELLRELGCDDAQGYFIARPMPATDLGKWMDDWLVRQGRARETG
jgi:CHASE3 domain sensor protein